MDIKQTGGYVLVDLGEIKSSEPAELNAIDPIILDTAHRLGKPIRARARIEAQEGCYILSPITIGGQIKAFTGLIVLLDTTATLGIINSGNGWGVAVTLNVRSE